MIQKRPESNCFESGLSWLSSDYLKKVHSLCPKFGHNNLDG
jgi:hypothetical protein